MSSVTSPACDAPFQTADGLYNYGKLYLSFHEPLVFGEITNLKPYTLDKLVVLCYQESARRLGWGNGHTSRIFKGQFGYDGYASSIGNLLANYKRGMSYEEMGKYIHNGWSAIYWYWRDNKPYVKDSRYIKPRNSLGDKRRDECAATEYHELNKDEKFKNVVIIDCLVKLLNL